MSGGETWAAVVISGFIRDVPRSAEAAVKAIGIIRLDAMRLSRRCRGIYAGGLERSAAEKLAAALTAAGDPSFSMPEAAIPAFGKPNVVRNADCLSDALHLQTDSSGTMTPLGWNEVRLLVAGVVREEERKYTAMLPGEMAAQEQRPSGIGEVVAGVAIGAVLGGLAGAIGAGVGALDPGPDAGSAVPMARKPRDKKPREDTVAEVFTLDPTIRVRFVSNTMNYDYLAGRLQPSGRANFKLFLGDIRRLAPRVVASPLADYACSGGDIGGKSTFDGEKDFDAHCRYLLAMIAAGRL